MNQTLHGSRAYEGFLVRLITAIIAVAQSIDTQLQGEARTSVSKLSPSPESEGEWSWRRLLTRAVPQRLRSFRDRHIGSFTVLIGVASLDAGVIAEGVIKEGWQSLAPYVLVSLIAMPITPLAVFAVVAWAGVTVLLIRAAGVASGESGQVTTQVQDAVDSQTVRYTLMLKISGDWQRRLAFLAIELAEAQDDTRREAVMTRFMESLIWDIAEVLGPNVVQSGSIAVPNPSDREYLVLRYLAGIHESRKEIRRFYIGADDRQNALRGICGLAWTSNIPVIVQDVRNDERYCRAPNDPRPYPPYLALLAVPVPHDGRPAAVLCIDGRTENCFDAAFAPLVATVAAGYVGSAIHLAEAQALRLPAARNS